MARCDRWLAGIDGEFDKGIAQGGRFTLPAEPAISELIVVSEGPVPSIGIRRHSIPKLPFNPAARTLLADKTVTGTITA